MSSHAKSVSKTKTCFVVGPIGGAQSATRKHADWLLEMIIQPAFKDNFEDFQVVRSDIINDPGMIDAQMIGHLLDADLVIADMSERNPNAFYEMGIRHMTSKPIIHMYLRGTEIPFDVVPYRAIEFSLERPADLRSAQAMLVAAVKATLEPDYKVENPVTRARGVQKLVDDATPGLQVLVEQISEVSARLHQIERAQVPSVDKKFMEWTKLKSDTSTLLSALRETPQYRPVVRVRYAAGLPERQLQENDLTIVSLVRAAFDEPDLAFTRTGEELNIQLNQLTSSSAFRNLVPAIENHKDVEHVTFIVP